MEPSTLITAYSRGLFPMPVSRRRLGWFSPEPRGVLPADGLRVSRSLRRSLRRYEVRFDTDFDGIIGACAALPRRHGWITPEIEAAYRRLHRLGFAHSVETWDGNRLVGGLYGVGIRGLFAGESMFHTALDASKVALVALVDHLSHIGAPLLDVQWVTPHLASLGAIDIPRGTYLRRLAGALEVPGWGPAPVPG